MTTVDIRPFTLNVPESELEDLRERLRRTRWPANAPGAPWTYGTDFAYLKGLVAYWLDGYDWRAQEARLNALPQFVAPVDGRDVHFAYVRGNGPNPLPLLISHGWPGSFVEMLDVIGPLADPGAHGGDPADAFDVVVPSLPGYGFSAPPEGNHTGIPNAHRTLVFIGAPTGEHQLELVHYIDPPSPDGERPERNQLGAAHVCFNVEDLPALYAKLTALGVRFVTPPKMQTRPDGRQSGICYAQDPEGNWLEFIQPA
jgi:catechol 2,3-dioxygenase-like lactoylglutathione lyase family enzyme